MFVNAGLILVRTGLFAEGKFLGRLLDEWASDAQEFLRSKLPHLIIIALIAFILMRLLRVITWRMIHVAQRHAAFASPR
jgi:small conductance mechanosensitive channel